MGREASEPSPILQEDLKFHLDHVYFGEMKNNANFSNYQSIIFREDFACSERAAAATIA